MTHTRCWSFKASDQQGLGLVATSCHRWRSRDPSTTRARALTRRTRSSAGASRVGGSSGGCSRSGVHPQEVFRASSLPGGFSSARLTSPGLHPPGIEHTHGLISPDSLPPSIIAPPPDSELQNRACRPPPHGWCRWHSLPAGQPGRAGRSRPWMLPGSDPHVRSRRPPLGCGPLPMRWGELLARAWDLTLFAPCHGLCPESVVSRRKLFRRGSPYTRRGLLRHSMQAIWALIRRSLDRPWV